MNKDKIIKDLKERNDKLSNQYRLRDIRCVHLEKEIEEQAEEYQKALDETMSEKMDLEEKIKTYEDPEDLTLMFMYCNEKAKDKIKELQNKIDKAIEYLKDREEDNECCSVCSVMSDKLLKILGGDVDDE